jgi:pimeloyl-ACP methyl ester carboxylesterase
VRVPENRAKPGGRAIPLRVLVLPATGRAPAADPVVFLAGGPGQAATGLARFHRNSPLRAARDLVFADQRGTGGSGDLRCAFYSTGGSAARFDDFIPAATVPACRERLERSADLSQYTTAASVADLEDVRRALGYDSLNLVGGSYGTRLAMEYLRAYPSRVRTVTLEGAVPPTMPVPEAFGVLAQRALDGVLDECLADAACGRAFPDIKREARAVFERLRSAPVTVHLPGGAIEMTGEHVAEAIRYMLYSSEQASRVPLALHAAYNGDFTRPAQFLLDWRRDGTFDAVYLSITCTEDVPFVAPGADAHDRPTFLGDYRLRQQRAACQAWPRGDPPAWRGKPVEADVPALIVSGRLDPVTPPEKGAEVARTLPNSLHVQVPSGGHSWQGLAGVDCIERLKAAFIGRGSVAGLDAACVAAIARRGFGVQ